MIVHIDIQTGLLTHVKYLASPHCDARPIDCTLDLIVIHNISLPPGQFGGAFIDDFFMNRLDPALHPYFAEIAGRRVSAHLLIARDGVITQYVSFHQRAWHAGESQFQGRCACNDFSVGIELEGTDELPYTDAQYTTLVGVIHVLMATYPTLSSTRIVGHNDIAPTRKTDPGPAFDWTRLRQALQQGALNESLL